MTIKHKYGALFTGLLALAFVSATAFAADLGTGGYASAMKTKKLMKMIDGNDDHMVTLAEFEAFNNSVFDELDKDKDGSLDAKEWVGEKSSKSISVATGGYSSALRKLPMMDEMDTNDDHKVTKEEFTKYQVSIFHKMDASGDKQLDAKEWLAKQVG